MEKDDDRKQMVAPVSVVSSLMDLAQFIEDSRSGLTRKQVNYKYKAKSIRNARSIVIYAQKKGHNTAKTVTLGYNELEENLEKTTGTKFIADAVEELAPETSDLEG